MPIDPEVLAAFEEDLKQMSSNAHEFTDMHKMVEYLTREVKRITEKYEDFRIKKDG
jgi:hypothetical protein